MEENQEQPVEQQNATENVENTDENQTQVNEPQPQQEEPQQEETMSDELEEVGFGGKLISFLIPIVGVILYFVNKNERKNPNDYLVWALVGFIIGLICNLMTTAASM